MYDSTIIAQILWTSVASSSFQVLFTIAFALVLKVSNIWNFTQPAMMGVAFYTMFTCVNWLGMPIILAVAVALLLTVATACGIERYGFVTLRKRDADPITFFIFTFIFAQFVIFVLTLIFTTEPRFMLESMMSPIRIVGGIIISDWDLEAIAVTVTLTVALYLFLRYSRPGQFMIAVADNADLAEVYGISKNASFTWAMVVSAIFITAAMYVYGGKLVLYPELTLHVMLFAIAATIVGGIGNVFGAATAAVAISVIQQLSVLIVASRWQPLVVFGVLFIAIVFFPRGVRLPRRIRADGRADAATSAGDGVLAEPAAQPERETGIGLRATYLTPPRR